MPGAAPGPAPAALFDSHAHLTDERFATDLPAVLRRAAQANVAEVLLPATDPEDAGRARELAGTSFETAPRLLWSSGLHPHSAARWGPETSARLEAELDRGAVAVGETGLDYHYEFAPRGAQREAFQAQAELARARDLPLVVHSRAADVEIAEVLRASGLGAHRVILHSFSGGPDLLRAALEEGWYVSFSGMATFKSFDPRPVAAVAPERLLLETDAPYLAPVPLRGKRNEPAFLGATLNRVADLRGIDPAEAAALTRANARRVYKLAASP
ncbi:MAG: TatD family hydrolase [Gemmatimonadota bacterium]